MTHVLLFPIYAVVIWALAMHWRRRWPAFAIVACGTALLVGAVRLCMRLDLLPATAKIFYELLWPYILLLGGMGTYIACLPRRAREHECQRCHYDLRGLDPLALTCPECGAEWRGRGSGREAKHEELVPIPGRTPKRVAGSSLPAVSHGSASTTRPSAE